jgi:hypothetical protein
MSDLNKIINEQRERIAELESDKEALDRENSSLANLVKNSVKRAEAAEKQVRELTEYATHQALLPSASFGGVLELVNDIHKNATDAGGCYEVSTGLLDSLFEAFTDAGACKLLNKFAIEQQIKALEEALHTVANQYNGTGSTEWSVLRLFVKHTSRLRQQLNGGERWGQ